MELRLALAIVLDLAEDNALDADDCDSVLKEEALRQEEAISVVQNLSKSAMCRIPKRGKTKWQ